MAEVATKHLEEIGPEENKFYLRQVEIVLASTYVLLGTLYLFFSWKFDFWAKKGYFYLKPVPFWGNFADLFLFRKSIGEFFRDIYLENPYETVVGLWLFRKPVLMLRNSELIKKVLIKDFDSFRDRTMHVDPIHDPLGFNGLFVLKDPTWRLLRTQLSPLFTGNKIKQLTKEMLNHSLHLIKRVNTEHVQKCQPAEMKKLCALYTTDVIGSAAWGIEAGALSSPETSFLRKTCSKLFEFNARRSLEMSCAFFLPDVAKLFNFKLFSDGSGADLKSVFIRVVEEREKEISEGSPSRTGDLIETLIKLKNNPPKDGIDYNDDVLAAQALTFFTAGFETSSSTLSFVTYELAHQSSIQDILFKEVNAITNGSLENITYENIAKMSYLDMCIKETLRKYPPLPFLDRMCTKDFKWTPSDPDLKPVTIEKGTHVYIPMLGIQMDPNIHKNPIQFDPERFRPDRKGDGSTMEYLPFGVGPRNCIGERFGLMQTKFALAALVQSFIFSPAPGSVRPENLTIDKKALTYQSEEPLNVCFKLRT